MSLLPIGRAIVADSELNHLLYVSETLKLLGVPEVETYNDVATAGRRAGAASFDLALIASDGEASSFKAACVHAELKVSGALVVAMVPAAVLQANSGLAQSLGVDLAIAAPFTRSSLYSQLAALLEGEAGRRLKIVELPARAFPRAPVSQGGKTKIREANSRARIIFVRGAAC